MLRTRLLTAAVALPVVLAAIFLLPAAGFSIFIFIVGMWGLYEVAEMTDGKSQYFRLLILGVLPLVLLLASPRLVDDNPGFAIVPILSGLAMLALVGLVARNGAEEVRRDAWHRAFLLPLGAFSVGAMFPYFALVRNSPKGIELILLMLLLVICTDTGAYFVGRAIGRHKLAFKVSPGKTVEGGIGGVIASIAASLILRRWLVPQWSASETIVYAGIVAILAIVGDLANSAFKRVAGVKDSGWILPGHGGLLDRTCSLVFAAVLTYYYSR